MGETLGTYLVRTRRLLHDLPLGYTPDPTNTNPNQIYSDFDLTGDINEALNERDLWSGGTRFFQSGIPLVIGQDQYPFTTLFPAIYAAGKVVLDVIGLAIIYGSTRYVLDNPSFTKMTTSTRILTTYQNRPMQFTRYGASTLFIDPAPSTVYTAEADTVLLSAVLVNSADPDPLPYPYTKPVPFYAAYLAYLNQGRDDKAERMFGYYIRNMRDIEGARVGQLLSAYTETRRGTSLSTG